jgi:hypothetical protein
LEQSLDFIKGKLRNWFSQNAPQLTQFSLFSSSGFIAHSNQFHEQVFTCSDGSSAQFTNSQFDKIIGIIGGQSSSISIQVCNLITLFCKQAAFSEFESRRRNFPEIDWHNLSDCAVPFLFLTGCKSLALIPSPSNQLHVHITTTQQPRAIPVLFPHRSFGPEPSSRNTRHSQVWIPGI